MNTVLKKKIHLLGGEYAIFFLRFFSTQNAEWTVGLVTDRSSAKNVWHPGDFVAVGSYHPEITKESVH